MRTLSVVLLVPLVAGTAPKVQAQDTVATTLIASRAVATLKVPGFADFLVADGKAGWVTNRGRIEKLDRDHTQPVLTATMPSPCGAMAVGFGAVWVANCRDSSVYRVNRKSACVVARIPTGLADLRGELSLAVGAGSVWVLSDRAGVLSRIDPRTNSVIARIAVAPNSFAAVFGFGSVWISNTGASNAGAPNAGTTTATGGAVQRIDPATNQVVATILVGPTPRFLAAGERGVWTLNQGDGTVSRVDPKTNTVIATIAVGVPGGGGDIDAGGGAVWVRASRVLLSVIDPRSNRVVERLGPVAGSGAVRVAGNAVWVTAHDVSAVWVLRRKTQWFTVVSWSYISAVHFLYRCLVALSIKDAETDRLADTTVRRVQERLASLPLLDARNADELLGYDEHGVPR